MLDHLLSVTTCLLLLTMLASCEANPQQLDDQLAGKWDMVRVTIFNNDVAETLNPGGDRWLSFAGDGTFSSGSGEQRENGGTYALDENSVHLDSDAGPGDDSSWAVSFHGDTLRMRGIGTERQENSVVEFVRGE